MLPITIRALLSRRQAELHRKMESPSRPGTSSSVAAAAARQQPQRYRTVESSTYTYDELRLVADKWNDKRNHNFGKRLSPSAAAMLRDLVEASWSAQVGLYSYGSSRHPGRRRLACIVMARRGIMVGAGWPM